MRALVWDGSQARVVVDAPRPAIAPGMAVVRVRFAGICSTDLQILAGYMGFRGILGHEFVGEVEEGPPELVGKRVVGEINFACGRCSTCLARRPRHCPTRSVLGILGADGAFAELVRLPVANLHLVPDSIDDRRAVFVEPLAAAFEGADQTRDLAGGSVAVIGSGKLGLLLTQVLAARGDRVSLICHRASSLQRVRARLGSRLTALSVATSLRDQVTRGFDMVVEASGSREGLAAAMELVRPEGTILLKSTVAGPHTLDLAPLVIDEVRVIGSRCGPFTPAIEALARNDVAVEPLIDEQLPLTAARQALDQAARPGTLKVLLEPGR